MRACGTKTCQLDCKRAGPDNHVRHRARFGWDEDLRDHASAGIREASAGGFSSGIVRIQNRHHHQLHQQQRRAGVVPPRSALGRQRDAPCGESCARARARLSFHPPLLNLLTRTTIYLSKANTRSAEIDADGRVSFCYVHLGFVDALFLFARPGSIFTVRWFHAL